MEKESKAENRSIPIRVTIDKRLEKILVHEEDGRLDLEIRLKAPFRDHLDVFENGAQTDCFPTADFDYDRLGAAIYGDYYAG